MNAKVGAALVLVAVATGAAAFFMFRGPGELTLADPACPPDAPVFAINLNGDLRQDDVAVVDREGHLTRLTTDHKSIEGRFSPDGKRIVFTSGREGPAEECCGYLDQEIYVMNSDGSDQRRLMPEGDHFEGSPAWSPDGTEIAFWRRGEGIMAVPAKGGEPDVLYEERRLDLYGVSWSPDGQHLAFSTRESIFILERATREVRPLVEGIGHIDEFAWSPDGSTLAFGAETGIYASTLEEPNPRKIIDDAEGVDWSPDGEWLAYYAIDEGGDVHMRLAAQPVVGGDPTFIDIDKKNIYSSDIDIDWLDCR